MRNTTVVCLGLVLVGVGLCCWRTARSRQVSSALTQQVRRGPGTVIDFVEVAPFPWDRLYIFGPYTSAEHIHACLGYPWEGVLSTSIEGNEGVNLMVFVQGGKVVEWLEYPRREAELEDLDDPNGHAREEARFLVGRLDPDQRLTLRKEAKESQRDNVAEDDP